MLFLRQNSKYFPSLSPILYLDNPPDNKLEIAKKPKKQLKSTDFGIFIDK